MMVNKVGRELPEQVGSYHVRPYSGMHEEQEYQGKVLSGRTAGHALSGQNKLLPNLTEAIRAAGLADGMTISFHHSFREGDFVMGQVLTDIRSLGIKNLRFAPSSLMNLRQYRTEK